jgi:ATP-dependent helicase/nuclease subunit B
MSTVRLLSPKINLVEEVVTLLGVSSEQKDFSRSIVVFPGKRPAHVLRKKLAEKIGSSFIPPKLFSIDVFIDFLCVTHLQNRAEAVSEFDAIAILFELHKAMQEDEKIGKEHFSELETFYPVGVKIYSELEELMIASVSPKRLSEVVESVTLVSAHAVALLYDPFYQELQKRKLTSRAQKYKLLADRVSEIDLSAYETIVLAGFYAFTQTEETLLRHLLAQKNVMLLFQNGAGIQTTLDQLKLDPALEGEEPETEHHFYESPDAHGELFALNRVLNDTFPQPILDSEQASIILPSSENLFPLYHQTLSIYEQSEYNLALGYPISRTPVYGFLSSLLDVIVSSRSGEVFVPAYIQFLLHPYTKNILYKTRTDVTRTIIHAIEDDCLEHSARVFLNLEIVENDGQLQKKIVDRLERDGVAVTTDEIHDHIVMIHSVLLRSLLKISSVGEFASACIGVLNFINEHSTAHRHPYFRPFVETLMEQFASLQQSLLAGYSFGKLEHYLLFLRHFIETADVPFTGTPLQGLQVLGFLEMRGLQFEHVFVIDVNDDILPGKAQQDVLLPLTLRDQLGLSTYRDQERIKAYIFDVLRRGANYVHCFYINNNEKEQSRFIAQLQWKLQLQNKTLKPFNTQSQSYQIDLGTQNPAVILKTPEMIAGIKELQFSSTALDTYLTCGLKFYYRYVLRIMEKNEISGDVEQTDVGKIIHSILFEYFAPTKDRKLELADLDIERLRRVIQDNFRSFYGSTQFGEQFFTKQRVEKHFIEFIEQYQRPLIESSSVIVEALEEKFAADIEEFHFVGNADRIETRDEKTFILDFKSGQHEANYLIDFDKLIVDDRQTWKRSIGSVQLVLYVMLYSVLRNIEPELINPAFVFLGKKELNNEIEISLFESDAQMKVWYPKLKNIILFLTKEIVDETESFNPTNDIKNDCPDCPYRTICGTQWAEKFSLY